MNYLAIKNGEVEEYGTLDFSDLTNDENCIIIKLKETTKAQYEELQKQKKQFNRSKIKRETQRMVDEELYGEDYEL